MMEGVELVEMVEEVEVVEGGDERSCLGQMRLFVKHLSGRLTDEASSSIALHERYASAFMHQRIHCQMHKCTSEQEHKLSLPT